MRHYMRSIYERALNYDADAQESCFGLGKSHHEFIHISFLFLFFYVKID